MSTMLQNMHASMPSMTEPPRGNRYRTMYLVCLTILLSLSWTSRQTGVAAFSPCKGGCNAQKISQQIRPGSIGKIFSINKAGEDGNSSNDNDSDNVTPNTSLFTSSPVTINPATTTTTPSSTESKPKPSNTKTKTGKVNSATLQFNNKLNRMAKSWDATTAPKVEALLLEALKNYQDNMKISEDDESQVEDNNNNGNVDGEAATASNKKQQQQNMNMIIVPNTVSFTNAITAWARCTRKDAAKRAHALLDKMHTLYKQGEGWEHVKPNKISYNSVITAWARSRERGSARHAEDLLRDMYDFYNEQGGEGDNTKENNNGNNNNNDNLKPDSRSWNAVINAVARSRDENCADRAKFLLDEMGRLYNEGDDDLLPDALTFGAIINAYANSFEEGASDKAAQLLMHMESLYSVGFDNAKPTTFVYNACMNAFAKDPLISNSTTDSGGATLNRAEQAEQLLVSMEKRYEEEKDHRVMPDCISYSTVINAHANSKTPQSGVRADALLCRMTNRFLIGDTKCKPNAISFTAAIKAHSAAINATLSLAEEETSTSSLQINSSTQQKIEASARRCEDLLQQLCLMYQLPGNDRSLKPTSVTFELAMKTLTQVEDWEGVERVKLLRASMS